MKLPHSPRDFPRIFLPALGFPKNFPPRTREKAAKSRESEHMDYIEQYIPGVGHRNE